MDKDAADIEAARAFGEAAEMIRCDAKAPEALADAIEELLRAALSVPDAVR